MKYIKTYENLNMEDEPIDLVGYPSGSIIEINQDELDLLEGEFDISWDDEPDYEEGIMGQWRYMDEDEDDIEVWLDGYRKIGDPELYKNSKKYNI